MRNALLALGVIAVLVLAFWAYKENYRTKAAIDQMGAVRQDIAMLRESLGVQRAEWAYLNRPDRLRELVNLNFDRLNLVLFEPNQFASPSQIARPAPKAPEEPTVEAEEVSQ